MPKLPFFKASPWMLAAEAAMAARRHWSDLEPADQRRLRELLPKARPGSSGLSAKEKDELRAIVRKLDVVGIGKEILPVVGNRYKKQRARGRR